MALRDRNAEAMDAAREPGSGKTKPMAFW